MVDIARPDLPVSRRRRQLLVCGAAVAALGMVSFAVSRLQPAAPVVERAAVWIDTVKRGPLVRELRGTGTLVPEDLRWIPAVADGRVDRIRLHPGAPVAADTVILELSNPDLDQKVRDAVLALGSAKAGLANRRVELEGALLAAQAAVAQLDAELREARFDADAEQQLHDQGLSSAITLRAKRVRAENLEQRLSFERERLALQRRALPLQLAIHEAEVARHRVALTQVEALRDALAVRAGVAGVLQQVAVELGARVAPGVNLARVVDPSRLKAALRIPEVQAKDVQVGQRAVIDTHHGTVQGRVGRVDPAAVDGSVTVDVVLEGELPRGARPDVSIDGAIEIERLADVVFVGRPGAAIEGGQLSLYRLDATGYAVRVSVLLGRLSANAAEVRAGLRPGDQVILSDMSPWDGVDRIRLR